MSERHRNALLAAISQEPGSAARAQDTSCPLFQETRRQEGSLVVYRLDRLKGSSEPFVACRPESQVVRVSHHGVTPATFGTFSKGSHRCTYRWIFPDLGIPIAIAVDNPDPNLTPVLDDIFVATGQTGAVLELQCEVGTRPQGSAEVFTVMGQFLLNGQPVLKLDTTGGKVQRDASGAVTNQASLPIVPIFEHPASGSFRLSADQDGQSILDQAYIQRGLEWAQPWPELENLPLDQPVEFSNQLRWDTGEPLDDDDGPRWRATVAGIDYPPDASSWQPQYNAGSQVSFRFNTDEAHVTARARASGARTLTLLPDDANVEYPSVEAWRQACEDCAAVACYSVEGQAITYQAPPALYTTAEMFTENVQARVRKLFVTGTRFEPNPIEHDPSQGRPLVLKAEVASCLFVEPQVRWSLTVRCERPAADRGPRVESCTFVVPGHDWQDLTEGLILEVPWNGQGPDGQPIPEGTCHAELHVDVREKNRVDGSGNVIMKSATGTADLKAQAGPLIDITPLSAGTYPVEVVATDPSDPSLSASDTSDPDSQVGQAQAHRVEVSNFHFVLPPGQESLDVENGGIGFYEADLTPAGFSNPGPQVHWTLTFFKDGARVGQVQGVQAPGPWTLPWDGSVEEGIKLGEGQVDATLAAFACEDDRLAERAHGQEFPPAADLSEFPFRLSESDFPAGYRQDFQSPGMRAPNHLESVATIPPDAYATYNYPGLWESWSPPGTPGGGVGVLYAICPSRQCAAMVFADFVNDQPALFQEVTLPDIRADRVVAGNGSYVMTVDRAVFRILVRGMPPDQKDALARDLLATVHDRLWARGIRPGLPFSLRSERVTSPVVNFATGKTFSVDYSVDTDPGYLPLLCRVDASADVVVFFRDYQSAQTEITAGWDGLDRQGVRVPDGTYQVSIQLGDLLGRKIHREYTVQVSSQPLSH